MTSVALVNVEANSYMSLSKGLVAYFNYLSVAVSEDQLISGLPVVDGQLTVDLLKRAVSRTGYVVSREKRKALKKSDFPCCAIMKDNSCAVIVDQTVNGFLMLKAEGPDLLEVIEFDTFRKDSTGEIYKLHPSVDLLQDRYSPIVHKRHWFWQRVFGKFSHTFEIVVSSLFANVLAVIVSLFALQVYDRVIPSESQPTLWVLAGGAAIAIVFEAFLRIARARLIDQIGKSAEIEISADLFARLVRFPMDRLPMPPGSMAHAIREFSSIKSFFSTSAVGVVSDLPFVVIFLAVLYLIGGPIVWVVVVGGIVMLIPSIMMRRRLSELSEESMGGSAAAAQLLNEAAYGLETLKLARLENFLQRQWEEVVALNATRTTEQRKLTAFLSFWSASVSQVTYVSVIIASVYMLFLGEFTLGSIIAMSILSSRTLAPVSQLSNIILQWQNMKAALASLDVLMTAELDHDPSKTYLRRERFKGTITLNNVQVVNEDTNENRVDIHSFEVRPGNRVALVGGNGSGKTSILNLMSGLLRPTSGEVLLDGTNINQIEPTDLRNNLGYLPQNIVLFRGTLRENLQSAGRQVSDQELMEALDFAGLGAFVRSRPEGLDLRIIDGGTGLSVGQRQCVGIARIYLQDPPIVLLDEPTSALDQTLEKHLVQRFGAWMAGRTVIVATHRPQIIEIMQHIAVVQAGRVVQGGPARKLLEDASRKSALRKSAQQH